jgi:LuxR family transcriptional regulator, activator of conjugal transfer of Ti plasmids
MHRIFQSFIDQLSASSDAPSLRAAMADAAAQLELHCFAYLSMQSTPEVRALAISTYPMDWTTLYLQEHFERLDPVIIQAARDMQPFLWGAGTDAFALSKSQKDFLDLAAAYGIRWGFTIPIHEEGHSAALTFAADESRRVFRRCIKRTRRLLQPMATCFHAHVRRKLSVARIVGGVQLSPREFECLEWAARGKTAWEIGCILKISRRTVAFHLDNAKEKLGVHTIVQAVARLSESRLQI